MSANLQERARYARELAGKRRRRDAGSENDTNHTQASERVTQGAANARTRVHEEYAEEWSQTAELN